ncbi:winged helix-turn-helix transcriptional regulator [Acuticoccus kandeliae]|uniref:winged helix-turn-helix transcriptional regulator n=1 Tax=Acuticoccus kandeliae TaxID=2073160 RepID=UPI000D3E5F65|nr:winged helix-turn-helix transcriptional regulator [Acuticoccus kandeliae]
MRPDTDTDDRRRYNDACAAAHALDLVGERWALLVMRELMTGPKRFSDLRANLPGISANILTRRLHGLEGIGVVERRELPPPAASKVYALTAWGYQAEPILRELGRWAARSPWHDPTMPFSSASLLLSLRTMFDAGRAAATGVDARVGFAVGHDRFLARISGAGIDVDHGDLDLADVVLTGAPEAVVGLLYGGVPLADLEASGALSVDGDRALAAALPGLFPLPPKAEVASD